MSINETVKCDFGSILDKPCNKLDYSRSVRLNRLSDLNPEQQSSLLWRSNLTEHRSDDMTICNHHLEQFGRIFHKNKTKCCGVINQHKRKVKGQKIISIDTAVNLKQKGQKVIPGQKFCRQCINQHEKIMKEPEEIAIDKNETETEEELQTEEDGVEYEESPRKKQHKFGICWSFTHQFSWTTKHSRVTRAKDKLESVIEKYQKSIFDG